MPHSNRPVIVFNKKTLKPQLINKPAQQLLSLKDCHSESWIEAIDPSVREQFLYSISIPFENKPFISETLLKGIPHKIEVKMQHSENGAEMIELLFLTGGASLNDYSLSELTDSTDNLTGLQARTNFILNLSKEFIKARHENIDLALLSIDVDNMTNINNFYGHDMGDAILLHVSRTIIQHLKSSLMHDAIVGKMDGDEFGILIKAANKEKIAVFCQRLLYQLSGNPFPDEMPDLHMTTSIGVSFLTPLIKDSNDLLKNADIAVEKAKHAGKNTFVFFDSQMKLQKVETTRIEQASRKALTEGGNLFVYYQPKFDLQTMETVGLEALVRLLADDGTFIPPETFIDAIDRLNLTEKFTEFVLTTVAKDILTLKQNKLNVPIAINLSSKQLSLKSLNGLILSLFSRYELSSDDIFFEITEQHLIEEHSNAIETIEHFGYYGIKVDLDDFGTGYATFKALQTIPLKNINALKIEKAFINDIEKNLKSETEENDEDKLLTSKVIIKTIINLTKELDIHSVAEGIETPLQLSYLKSIGCDYGQGYFHSKPMAFPQTIEFLKKQNINWVG